MIADDVVDLARGQVGTPFLHQGRIPGIGLDCAGLAAYIASKLNLDFNEWPGYGRTPSAGLLQSVLDNQPCLIVVGKALPGDLLLMRFFKEPQHVAVCAGDTIIHSYCAVEQVCEHTFDDKWKKRVVRIYRFKDIES